MSEAAKRERRDEDDTALRKTLKRQLKGLTKAENATDVLIDAKRHGERLQLFAPGDPQGKPHRTGLNAVVVCNLCGWATRQSDSMTERTAMSIQAVGGKELDAMGYHVAMYMRSSEVEGAEDVRWGVFHGTCAKAIRAWAAFEHPLETLIEATQHLLKSKTCDATVAKPVQPMMAIDEYVAKRQKREEAGVD